MSYGFYPLASGASGKVLARREPPKGNRAWEREGDCSRALPRVREREKKRYAYRWPVEGGDGGREGEGEREGKAGDGGDHHRNDRSDGLGRPSTTRDLPDVAGMNESAHIRTVYETTKGL